MHHIAKIITYFLWGLWRLLLIILGVSFYCAVWLAPAFYMGEDSIFSALWAIGFLFGTFYALALWHVVSEDTRALPIKTKIHNALFVSFNKMLFGLLVFIVYVTTIGILFGEA